MGTPAGIKSIVAVVLLVVFWLWETWRPFQGQGVGVGGAARWRHAARNLAIALLNTTVLAVAFSTATVATADWAAGNSHGLLNRLGPGGLPGTLAAFVLLDAWMYVWHRANHRVGFLWRFHRMHHSDRRMDVTTATRFHLGEHVLSASLRLGLIPLLGLRVEHILMYDSLVIAVTQLHHADVSLGRIDRWLSWIVVTPNLHKVHHSRRRVETDSNYSTVFSWWDRLAGTLRTRSDPRTIEFGLDEFDAPEWQTFRGMLATPFRNADSAHVLPPANSDESARPPAE